MPSVYTIAVLHTESGQIARWAPGLEAEVEFIDNLCRRVQAKGVGFLKTEAHVITDVRVAIMELLLDLKREVPPA